MTWRSDGAYPRPLAVSVVVHGSSLSGAVCDGVEVPSADISVRSGATTIRVGAFSELVLLRP